MILNNEYKEQVRLLLRIVPIISKVESLSPNLIDQRDALKNQFLGMTAIPFSYEEYEKTRIILIDYVNKNLNDRDKAFLISFEEGVPEWEKSDYATFKDYPSIQWKLLNINKLKATNPNKHQSGVEWFKKYFNWVV